MRKQIKLNKQRTIRKFRVSNAVKENSTRPRLTVFRTARHFYAQIIDDEAHKTLASANSLDKEFQALGIYSGNCTASAELGKMIAKHALAAGVTKVALDRNGHKYHGRIKAFADAARDAGLDIGGKGSVKEEAVSEPKPAKKEKKEKK